MHFTPVTPEHVAAFNILFAILCAFLASSKNRSVIIWFLLGGLFAWIPFIILLFLDDETKKK